eukprot:EG_transcript_23743
MADVEDLLEHLEKELGDAPGRSTTVTSPLGNSAPRARTNVDACEIDRLLDEVSHVTVGDAPPTPSGFADGSVVKAAGVSTSGSGLTGTSAGWKPSGESGSSNPATPTTGNAGRQRCGVVKVGGTDWPTGCSPTSMVDRKCDNLRCTKCDFRVIWFDNYAWSPTVNYIFLRNNVPDFFKLQEKLDPEKGSCAYACQCTSRTARELQAIGDLQWGCGGHQ